MSSSHHLQFFRASHIIYLAIITIFAFRLQIVEVDKENLNFNIIYAICIYVRRGTTNETTLFVAGSFPFGQYIYITK